ACEGVLPRSGNMMCLGSLVLWHPHWRAHSGSLHAEDDRLVGTAAECFGMLVRDLACKFIGIGVGAAIDITNMTDRARRQARHHQHLPVDIDRVANHPRAPAQDGGERPARALETALEA